MRKSLLRRYGNSFNEDDWIYVIDDTSNPKYGKAFKNVGFWGGSGGVYYGQKVLVIALVNLRTKFAVPIHYTILPKRSSDKSPKVYWHAIRLLNSCLKAGFPRLTVVADSWFDSVKFMASIEGLGMAALIQIKSNRKVKTNPSPNVSWNSLNSAFEGERRFRAKTVWDGEAIQKRRKKAKCVAELVVQVKNRKSPLKVIAAFNRRNSKSPFGYYATTLRTMPRARVWMLSRARWSIECIFRTCKQYLSFGSLSLKGKEASDLAVSMPLFLYAKLMQECPKGIPLTKFIVEIKEKSFEKAIDSLLYDSKPKAVELLRNRRSRARVNSKPCDSASGEILLAA